jgi:uncharacterized protein YaaN involved in tellurite resistance
MNTTQTSQSLEIADPVKIRQELALVDPAGLTASNVSDPQIERQADEFVSAVLAFNPKDPVLLEIREQHIAAAENLGVKTQREAAHRSAMLKEPIRKLAAKGEDGGEVANSLVSLKNQVEELDPGKFDLNPGWFTRTLGWLPGIGTPLKNYFTKFESSQTVIDAIIRSLDDGKKMLQRDNITLSQDQKAMRQMTLRLEKAVQLGMLIDQKIAYALEREITADDPRRRFIEDELLFPLRQRIQDLQQQLAVNQQGVLAVELIIRNNKELMKGVDRAVNVTVNALNVAVTVALALANQKIVLDKIEAVNKVTDHLIAQTAAQLRTQGVAVHKQASSAQLNIESLKKAFADINGALDDVSRFRQEALPRMADNILEMDRLTRTAEESIRRMEQGNKAEPVIFLDVEE